MKLYDSLVSKALHAKKPANIIISFNEALNLKNDILKAQEYLVDLVDGYTTYDLSRQLGISEEESNLLLKNTKYNLNNIIGFDSFIKEIENGKDFQVSANLIIDIYEKLQDLKQSLKVAIDDDHAFDLSDRSGLNIATCENIISLAS